MIEDCAPADLDAWLVATAHAAGQPAGKNHTQGPVPAQSSLAAPLRACRAGSSSTVGSDVLVEDDPILA